MSKDDKVTRKSFLKHLSLAGVASLGAGSFLSACGGGDGNQESASQSQNNGSDQSTADDPCSDVSDLTEQEKQTRDQFDYVAETPDPEKRCDNCALWVEPEGDEPCGGCTLVKGPIHPAGYCTAWAPQS